MKLSYEQKAWLCLLAVLFALTMLSERSGYSIRDLKTVNWDVVLMLTPSGIVNNLLLTPEHYLRPYYSQHSERGDLFGDPAMVVLLLLVGCMAILGLLSFRKSRKPIA